MRSFASFAALILGVLLGMKFSNWLSTVLAQHLDFSKSIIFIISFIIIFITVIIVINITGKILNKFIEKTVINLPNKILGLIFGLLKGVLILSVIIALYNWFDPNGKFLKLEKRDNSLLYNPISKVVPKIMTDVFNYQLDSQDGKMPKKEESAPPLNKTV